MLGCRLWATSHANSDKVPLSPSRFLCPSILPPSLSFSHTHSYCIHIPSSSLFVYSVPISLFFSLPLCLPGFIRQAIPTRGIPEAPQPPRTESQGISVPGTSACWLNLQSPLSLSERLAVLSLFLGPRFSPSLSDSHQDRFVRRHDRWRDRSIGCCMHLGSLTRSEKRYLFAVNRLSQTKI